MITSRLITPGRLLALFGMAGLAVIFVVLAGCEDEPVPRDYPRVKTLEVTSITPEGAVFTAEITEPGNGRISEHGFAWAVSTPNIDYDNRIYLGSFDAPGQFSAEISASLAEGVTYKVTAFVKSGEYTVYGNAVEFKSLGSLGPVITGFSPPRVNFGDTVTITGKNFSWISSSNIVRFNEERVVLCYPVCDTLLQVSVPYNLPGSENIISVEIAGNRTNFTTSPIFVDFPAVESFSPEAAYWCDTITLRLVNLRKDSPVSVKVGTENAVITSLFDGTSLRFTMPERLTLTENDLIVWCESYDFIAERKLRLLPPVIEYFKPNHGNWSDVVTLYGHFNPLLQGTSVTMGGKQAQIISAGKDSVRFTLPLTYYQSTGKITYSYNSLSCVSEGDFSLDNPVVTSLAPLSGYQGQTITIQGRNFNPASSTVKFNSISAAIISRNDSIIVCKVPGGLTNPVSVEVTAGTNTAEANEEFDILIPEVTSFLPASLSTGDTITIYGKDFSQDLVLYVKAGGFQDTPLEYLSVTPDVIRAVLPDCSLWMGPIYGRAFEYEFSTGSSMLYVAEPAIYSISPSTASKGQVVTLTGVNFSRIPSYNRIFFGSIQTTAISSTGTELQFIVPYLPNGTNNIVLQTGGYGIESPYSLTVTGSPWEYLDYMLFVGWRPVRVTMPFEDETYVLTNYYSSSDPTLYRFNPALKNFTGVGTYYVDNLYFASCVIKGRDAFFLANWNPVLLKKFNADDQTFSDMSTYPGSGWNNILLLDGDSVLYAGGGEIPASTSPSSGRDFYKYSPSRNKWTRLNDLPAGSGGTNEFTINGRCYILTKDGLLYEYSPSNDSWIRRADPPGEFYSYRMSVVCQGKAYVGYGCDDCNQVSYYDPVTDSWTSLEGEIPRGRSFPFAFEWDGSIYLGGGYAGGGYLGDMWKYDPALEKK